MRQGGRGEEEAVRRRRNEGSKKDRGREGGRTGQDAEGVRRNLAITSCPLI